MSATDVQRVPSVEVLERVAGHAAFSDAFDGAERVVLELERLARTFGPECPAGVRPTVEDIGAVWLLAEGLRLTGLKVGELGDRAEAILVRLDDLRTGGDRVAS